ncbi:MAG: hypothetical protein GYA24_20910 [Candidatus Lokiarchaeota archaeon]|nr:hypothetical protein [Candidatus Lokiarchaeota archaeon]
MNWIIYFTSYGNCRNLADMISKSDLPAMKEMRIENGELMTKNWLDKLKFEHLPRLIYLISPVRRHSVWKKARTWLAILAKELCQRESNPLPQRRDAPITPPAAPWRPRIALVLSHRFPEDRYKIELSVAKLLRKIKVSKQDTNMSMADLVVAPVLYITVEKVTGPLELAAADKVKSWITANAPVLFPAPSAQATGTDKEGSS